MPINLKEYGFIRIGTCAPELRVADIDFNTDKIIEAADSALESNCRFLLTPELSITGYTCGDLFFQTALLNKTIEAIEKLRQYTEKNNNTIVVGAPLALDGLLYNCAVFISKGETVGVIPKTYLCNNSEYYEERWFSCEFDRKDDYIRIGDEEVPFGADILFEISDMPGAIIGAEICEDLWTIIPPSSRMAAAGATIILNLSASNEYIGKTKYRTDLVMSQSSRLMGAYVYSACGPGESSGDTVFSGHCMIAENGNLLCQTEKFCFETRLVFADIDVNRLISERIRNNSYGAPTTDKTFRIAEIDLFADEETELSRKYARSPFLPSDTDKRREICDEIFNIQSFALAKRLKHINAKSAVIGVSGGLDSTLALLVTVNAFDILGLDKKGILAVTMPGYGTTKRTKSNADALMDLLGVSAKEINISAAVDLHFKEIGHDPENKDIVYENSQARYRTMLLMDLANQTGGIVIGTGDLSENALGWCTYNGDHMSMYGVNSGVPKTLVRAVCARRAELSENDNLKSALLDIIDTPVSPELLPPDKDGKIAQKTEKELGPYEIHDFFLYYTIRANYSPKKTLMLAILTFRDIYDPADILTWLKIFIRRFFMSQYKRSCVPDGVKIGTISLSPRAEWRMPSDASPAIWISEAESLTIENINVL